MRPLFLCCAALALAPPSGARAQESAPLSIREWLVCGPFANRDKTTRLTTDYLKAAGGERLILPDLKMESAGSAWQLARVDGPSLDLSSALHLGSADAANGTAYAHAYVRSPARRDGTALVGSDDGISVWVNAVHVHEHDVYRGFQADEDRFPITLEAGWNTILCKVTNGDGDFALGVRLEGFGDLEVRAAKPERFERPKLTPEIRIASASAGSAVEVVGGVEWPIVRLDVVLVNGDPANEHSVALQAGATSLQTPLLVLPPGERRQARMQATLSDVLALAAAGESVEVVARSEALPEARLTVPGATEIERYLLEPIDAT
jgi:hypothetical protein